MIKVFFDTFKRMLRTVYFPILLVILAVILYLAPVIGKEEAIPLAGVCDRDKSELSGRVTEYLTQNGYISVDDEALMREMIAKGDLNCGVIINKGFDESIRTDTAEEAVTFIISSLSYSPEVYRNHVSAAVFDQLAPIISAGELKATDITVDEYISEYRKFTDGGIRFSFKLETAGSNSAASNERPQTYFLGAASLLIFAVILYCVCDLLSRNIRSLAPRIGMTRTVFYSLIPDISVRIIGIFLSVLLSALAALFFRHDTLLLSLTLPVFIYSLLITAAAVLVFAVFGSTAGTHIFAFFLLLLGLIFCPIYMDISLVFKWCAAFRVLIAPYWLWLCADYPILTIAAVPIALSVSFAALYLRFSRRPIN